MMSPNIQKPFYCGLITHNLLEGKLIEGGMKKLFQKRFFLKVNEGSKKNSHGF